jgi:hypothetical protein
MDYNDLLMRMSQQMVQAVNSAKPGVKEASNITTPKGNDTTSTLLNKIGLEVQRQGG